MCVCVVRCGAAGRDNGDMIGGKELTDSPLLGSRNGMCGGGKKKKAEQDPSVVHSSCSCCCARGFVRFLDACRVVGAHC